MPSNSISRYISLESFINLVLTQKLTFSHHTLWDDPYDALLFKALAKEDGIKKIKDILNKYNLNNHISSIEIAKQFSHCIHGQSWTECEENDALWRIYSHNKKSLRIEVLIENISKLENVSINKITYTNTPSLENEVLAVFKKDNKIELGATLLTKRKAFEHEQEIRLISSINFDYLPSNQKNEAEINFWKEAFKLLLNKGQITEIEYKNGLKNLNPKVENILHRKICFKNINNFIHSVTVNPLAPTWYCDTIELFCQQNKINYLGKSKLYQFNI